MPEPDAVFDGAVVRAVELLVDSDPSLLDGPPDTSMRVTRETFTGHFLRMIAEVDARNFGKLPHSRVASWCGLDDSSGRALLGRYPLIPRVQSTRAALELAGGRSGNILTGIIKVYAGAKVTTSRQRGVHEFKPGYGFQLHMEFVVITVTGRTIPVSAERFAVEDATLDDARKFAYERMAKDRRAGAGDRGAAMAQYPDHIAAYYRTHWGPHKTGTPPHTLAEHLSALLSEARLGAELVGAPQLYAGIPILGGQLIASTRYEGLPKVLSRPLIGHDITSIERLLSSGTFPILDLNYVDKALPGKLADLELPIKLPDPRGTLIPHKGQQLLGAATDSRHAHDVPRAELRLPAASAFKLAVSYIDGEVDLPGGAQPVRIYCVIGLRNPHSLYLVLMDPSDDEAHRRTLPLIMADSTELHAQPRGPMALLRAAALKKGAFDPYGRKAETAESLAAIGRLAADRELHRQHVGH